MNRHDTLTARPPLRGWTTAAILVGIGALLDFLITAATATPV
ncbi:hypothetical protein [Denitromonas iodatirespirans]|nr:hypothetical protein [Denitromonas iodatirespirans]